MAVTDALLFLRTWMRDPRQIGAVVPSGPALARLITANIDHRTGPAQSIGVSPRPARANYGRWTVGSRTRLAVGNADVEALPRA